MNCFLHIEFFDVFFNPRDLSAFLTRTLHLTANIFLISDNHQKSCKYDVELFKKWLTEALCA